MSNEDAIKILNTLYSIDVYVNDALDLAIKVLEEHPQGEWIDEGVSGWKCNKCGYGVFRYNNTNFCPNCGADMRGSK